MLRFVTERHFAVEAVVLGIVIVGHADGERVHRLEGGGQSELAACACDVTRALKGAAGLKGNL